MEFLSEPWIKAYHQLWNENLSLVVGLGGFTALIEYGWEGEGKPSAFLQVKNGVAVSHHFGSAPAKPDFVMKATAEVWDKMRSGELGGRAALLSRKLKFQGSMITAMKYMNPFNKSIELIGQVN